MRGRALVAACSVAAAAAALVLTAGARGLPTVDAACRNALVGQTLVLAEEPRPYRLRCVAEPVAPPLPPPFAFTSFRPTATDLADEPSTELPLTGPLSALDGGQVPQRHRPKGRPATAADVAAYRAALGRLRAFDYRAVEADVPGEFSRVVDHQRAGDATRVSRFDGHGGLTVTSVEDGGHSYLPAPANNGGPGREDLVVPAHSWLGGASSAAGTDLDGLDPFRVECDGMCRLSVLPTVHGVRHFFVESFADGDGAFDQQGVDVAVTGGRITAFYDFEPGDDGQVYDTDVAQLYTVVADLPAGQPITTPGPSLVLDPAQVTLAVARARERADPPPAPQPPSGCPPGTPAGTECKYAFRDASG